MSVTAMPPQWAEALLRVCVRCSEFESVSGDLLEEYRDSVYPSRGPARADVWYVKQVLGFLWRAADVWALVLAAAFIARTGLDWRFPTMDFHSRSTISTVVGIGILLIAGFWAALRSGSFAAGPILGMAIAATAAPMKIMGAAILLAVWHDPATMVAIRGSGGLGEVFTLPILMVVPGIILGAAGGVLGRATQRLLSA